MVKIQRPLVAISSCLLGERVRYDGGHKHDAYISSVLSQQFDWKPVCPEVGAGMGAPRPPIQLVGDADHPRAVRVDNPAVDVTDALSDYARAIARELSGVSGYIFKSRSPSCGLEDVKLFDARGNETGCVSGIYARLVRERFPALPVIDERQLQNPDAQRQFLDAVFRNWHGADGAETA